MNSTLDLSPEKQQDNFILSFLYCLNKSYKQISDDEYQPLDEKATFKNEVQCFTAEECLALYRKQQIPPLSFLSAHTDKDMAIIKETQRQILVLFNGYQKLKSLLTVDSESQIFKQKIRDIIIETLEQITL